MLNYIAGIKTVSIAGPALTDLLAGNIDFLFTTPPLIQHIEAGTIKPLVVTSKNG
ncbi:hypothetical protein V757_03300 [Pelistega indica]|uniref:Uncharacterized protein n=1 Tax=Pelistega indica TaxID=1414851 RepID=V8G7T8_9BURK|nr:hypothetical protein V757_03300 [Pelistega indica]